MIITIDDFCEPNNKLDLLISLHEKNPALKFNLFTIPGLCSEQFIAKVQILYSEFIDMIPHGFLHTTPRECENWSYEMCELYIHYVENLDMTKGFKAPGWQISQPMYDILLKYGYWVADQHYNDNRRPKELKVHFPTEYHYHIGHMGGHNPNEIEMFTGQILSITESNFIKDEI